VEVLYGEGGEGDPELELSDDPGAGTRLDTAAVPLIITLAKVGCLHVEQRVADNGSGINAAAMLISAVRS